jgi:starch synthase
MAALVPVYLETNMHHGILSQTGSVLTIHNLQHQGYGERDILSYGGLSESLFRSDQLEACGGVNFLKGGIYFAGKLTTVSPTYAQEIQLPQCGWGLDDVLRFRSGDLIGITNGIDMDEWNPRDDSYLIQNYDIDHLESKKICKKSFCTHFFCEKGDEEMPLFVVISRLYWQKGLDILAHILPWIIETMRVKFAILGAGDCQLENHFRAIGANFPDRVWVHIGYDEALAHRMEAAGDFFVMPSRFEPCGLNQMYSMRYGTLPIVRATGGLKATVSSYAQGVEHATGFMFNDLTHQSLYNTIGWACATYYDRPQDIQIMRRNAMIQNFSWEKSAQHYVECYQWAQKMKCF